MHYVKRHTLGIVMEPSANDAWFVSHGSEDAPGFVTEFGLILQSLATAYERRGNAAYMRTCVAPDRLPHVPTYEVLRTGRIYVPGTDLEQSFYGYEGLRFFETNDKRIVNVIIGEGALLGAEIV